MNKIFKKQIMGKSYPSVHLDINYVWLFQEICIYFDRPRHPKWLAMTDERPLFAMLLNVFLERNNTT